MGKIKDILGLRKKKICLNMFVYNVGHKRGDNTGGLTNVVQFCPTPSTMPGKISIFFYRFYIIFSIFFKENLCQLITVWSCPTAEEAVGIRA